MARKAFTDPASAAVNYDKFQQDFRALEEPMAAFSEQLEQNFERINQQLEEIRKQANLFDVIALAAALAIAIGALLFLFKLDADQQRAKQQAEVDRKTAMARAAVDFEHGVGSIVASVSSAAGQLRQLAQALMNGVSQSVHVGSAMQENSNISSKNIGTVATASEELSASINEISMRTTETSSVTVRAVNEIESASKTIANLNHSVGQIESVTQLITQIAEKTNLLALNATIEAARAGEAGRGFAVVASEVKNLASQTAKATDDVRQLITKIQADTQQSVAAVRNLHGTIDNINHVSSAVAAAVEEQRAATEEISRNAQLTTTSTMEVSAAISQVVQTIENSGTSAKQVLAAADELSSRATELRTKSEQFIRDIQK